MYKYLCQKSDNMEALPLCLYIYRITVKKIRDYFEYMIIFIMKFWNSWDLDYFTRWLYVFIEHLVSRVFSFLRELKSCYVLNNKLPLCISQITDTLLRNSLSIINVAKCNLYTRTKINLVNCMQRKSIFYWPNNILDFFFLNFRQKLKFSSC